MDSSVIDVKSVRNKIIAQAEALKDNGIDVTVVISRKDEKVSRELDHEQRIKIIYLNNTPNNKYIGYFADLTDLLRFTSSLQKNDVLYTRYAPQSIFLIPRNCTVITEHQTKELMEYRSQSFLPFLMEKCIGRINRKLRDYYVAMTEEISEFESSYGEVGHVVIPNGISLKSIRPISKKDAVGDEFHIVGLANVSRWHGYDRIIEGLKEYSGTVRVYFHIVGDGEEISQPETPDQQAWIGETSDISRCQERSGTRCDHERLPSRGRSTGNSQKEDQRSSDTEESRILRKGNSFH